MEHNVGSTHGGGEDLPKLEQATAGGANWFYWIAGLSLVNSVITVFGGGWGFIVGLGFTQIIDAIGMAIAEEMGSGAATAAKVIALVGSVLVSGVFVVFGYFAGKRQNWAFIVGMVIYAFDGVLFLLFADWLSVGFHGFALFCIWSGFAASRKLAGISPAPTGQEPQPDPITP